MHFCGENKLWFICTSIGNNRTWTTTLNIPKQKEIKFSDLTELKTACKNEKIYGIILRRTPDSTNPDSTNPDSEEMDDIYIESFHMRNIRNLHYHQDIVNTVNINGYDKDIYIKAIALVNVFHRDLYMELYPERQAAFLEEEKKINELLEDVHRHYMSGKVYKPCKNDIADTQMVYYKNYLLTQLTHVFKNTKLNIGAILKIFKNQKYLDIWYQYFYHQDEQQKA
jgi:hypothetical protein